MPATLPQQLIVGHDQNPNESNFLDHVVVKAAGKENWLSFLGSQVWRLPHPPVGAAEPITKEETRWGSKVPTHVLSAQHVLYQKAFDRRFWV